MHWMLIFCMPSVLEKGKNLHVISLVKSGISQMSVVGSKHTGLQHMQLKGTFSSRLIWSMDLRAAISLTLVACS